MCRVPRLVTENAGTVGATLSCGSETVTLLLLPDFLPPASTAYMENE
jgi:hypothetical protein